MRKFVVRRGEALAHCQDAEQAAKLMCALSCGRNPGLAGMGAVADQLVQLSNTLQRAIAGRLGVHCSTLRDGEFHLRQRVKASGTEREARSCLKLLSEVNKAASVCRHFTAPWAEHVVSRTSSVLDGLALAQPDATFLQGQDIASASPSADAGDSPRACDLQGDGTALDGTSPALGAGMGGTAPPGESGIVGAARPPPAELLTCSDTGTLGSHGNLQSPSTHVDRGTGLPGAGGTASSEPACDSDSCFSAFSFEGALDTGKRRLESGYPGSSALPRWRLRRGALRRRGKGNGGVVLRSDWLADEDQRAGGNS